MISLMLYVVCATIHLTLAAVAVHLKCWQAAYIAVGMVAVLSIVRFAF